MKSNKLLVILASFIILLLTLSVVSAGVINNSNNCVNDDSSIKEFNSDTGVKKVDSDKSDVKKINSVEDDSSKNIKKESSDKKDKNNDKDSNNTTIKETTLKLKMSQSQEYINAILKEGSHELENEEIEFSIEKNGEKTTKIIKTDEKGVAQLDISDFISGKYHVTALFKGNENYTNSSDDIKFNISKIPTELSLSKSNKVVYAKLLDNSSNPISNKPVLFLVESSNGNIIKDKTVSTNSEGIASIDISGLSEGKYVIKAIFKGDSEFDRAYSNTITFEFNKIDTYIKVIPDVISNKFFSAILFDNNGKPLANKVLTFTVTKYGQTILSKSVETNKNGFAGISLEGINITDAFVSVSFSGDNEYKSSSNGFGFESLEGSNLNTTIGNSSLNATDGGLLAYLSGLFGGVFSYLDGAVNGALSGLIAYLNDLFNGISTFINNLISKIISLISGIINKIIAFIKGLIGSILSFLINLLQNILKFIGDLFNIDLSGLINNIGALINIISIIALVIVVILVVVVLYVFRKLG